MLYVLSIFPYWFWQIGFSILLPVFQVENFFERLSEHKWPPRFDEVGGPSLTLRHQPQKDRKNLQKETRPTLSTIKRINLTWSSFTPRTSRWNNTDLRPSRCESLFFDDKSLGHVNCFTNPFPRFKTLETIACYRIFPELYSIKWVCPFTQFRVSKQYFPSSCIPYISLQKHLNDCDILSGTQYS